MAAWECVQALMWAPVAQAVTVIQELLDRAETDQELCHVGAGPVEELLSHSGHDERAVAQIEQSVRRHPRFRRAMACVDLGTDLPADIRQRLELLRS